MTQDCAPDGGGAPLAAGPVNPAGLTRIAYRAGDFAAFRRALLSPLAGEQQLAGWAPAPGDLGLQMLEWWAYLADILTFYNERIANGSYLRTAAAQSGQGSAAALARLLGYLPAPAIAATGFIAAIRSPGAPDSNLKIPLGMQISSTPTADAPAQLFETGESRLFTGPTDVLIGLKASDTLFQPVTGNADRQSVLLAGRVSVTPGDQFVLVSSSWDGTNTDWAVVTAGSAVTEKDPNAAPNTRLTLESANWNALAAPADPPASAYKLQRPTATAQLWTMPTGGATSAGSPLTVPLATLARHVSPGDNVLFTGSTGGASPQPIRLLARVTGYGEEVAQVPATDSAGNAAAQNVYIPRTNLTIAVARTSKVFSEFQSVLGTSAVGGITMHYAFRDVGELISTPDAALASLQDAVNVPDLKLPGGYVALQDANGKGLIVTGPAGATGEVTLTQVESQPGKLPLAAPIRLLASIVAVSQGTTVPSEILGDGDPTTASQVFTLQHSPLIYLPPAASGGDPVSTLSVSVNGVPWRQVTAFSGQPPGATVYVTYQLADGSIQIRFGDGINGARLPLGTGNVTAAYRYGTPPAPGSPSPAPGSLPPVPSAGRLSTVLQPQPNLASVRNPVDLVPGRYPESPATTAAAAPATVALLGSPASPAPLVSLGDCELLAAGITGVTRVRAYWTWDAHRQCPAITVYVGTDADAGTAAAVASAGALFRAGASRAPLVAARARGIDLAVGCRLLCAHGTSPDAVSKAAVAALITAGGLFTPPSMGIGERLYRSQVESALMVGGVVAVFGLRVHRTVPEGAGPAPAGTEEPVLDPGQDGYFRLQQANLTVSVVTELVSTVRPLMRTPSASEVAV